MKVKITGANEYFWYANYLGGIFEVESHRIYEDTWTVIGGGKVGFGIKKHHSEIVSNDTPAPPASTPPPLGLRPASVVGALRIIEILGAMQRYAAENKRIPREWMTELDFLNNKVQGK